MNNADRCDGFPDVTAREWEWIDGRQAMNDAKLAGEYDHALETLPAAPPADRAKWLT